MLVAICKGQVKCRINSARSQLRCPVRQSSSRERRPPQKAAATEARLGVQMGEAGFGGGQGFFFFAEGEADLGGAVASVVVETGARDTGYADFFHEIFGERDVAG